MSKYQLTTNNRVINLLQEVERQYGRLEGLTIPKQLQLNLQRDNLVQSSHASNSIEGNPLTHAEVTNLLLDERIPVNRSEKEVRNYFDILETLHVHAPDELDTKLILTLHSHLMDGVENSIKGKIRDKQIVVGSHNEEGELKIKHNPPYHSESEIRQSLYDLCEWFKSADEPPLLQAGIFHHEFVYIHPFEDGNGRMTRLITALILLKRGYLVNKYFVLDDYYDIDKEQYSNKLHSADYGDKTEWLEYFLEGMKYSMQSSLSKIETGLQGLEFDMRPSSRERDVLELIKRYKQIQSSDVVDELGISRQQAYNLLNGLVEKGFVEKKGSTKNSYYVLV